MQIRTDLDAIADIRYAYLAGFIDGEGCIRITKTKIQDAARRRTHAYFLWMTAANTCEAVIRAIREEFGGDVADTRKYKKNPNWANSWRWRITGPRCAKIIERMLPFLIVKRNEALVALEFQRQARPRSNRTCTDEELRIRELLYYKIRAAGIQYKEYYGS